MFRSSKIQPAVGIEGVPGLREMQLMAAMGYTTVGFNRGII